MAWYDGFADFAKNALSETADFVSQNLGTIVGGFVEAGKDQASKAVQTYLPPASGGNLPSYASSVGAGGGVAQASASEGFPMATVLLLVGSVVVVALVLKK